MKPWFKKTILITGIAVMALAVSFAILLSVLDQQDYRLMAQKLIYRWTGWPVTIEGEFLLDLSLKPSLTASAIRFSTPSGGSGPLIDRIGRLDFQVELLPILRGLIVFKHIRLDDMTVKWDVQGNRSPDDLFKDFPGKSAFIGSPVVERLSLENICLEMINASLSEPVQLVLNRLTVDGVKNTGPLFVRGDGSFHGEAFILTGRLGPERDLDRRRGPFPVQIGLSSTPINLNVSGHIDNPIRGKGLNLQVAAEGDDISKIFKLCHFDIPLSGRFNLKATGTGDAAAPEISDLKITVTEGSEFQFSAQGSIGDLVTGNDTDIALVMDCQKPEFTRMLLPGIFSGFRHLTGTGRFCSSEGGFIINDLDAMSIDAHGVTVAGRGWLQLGSAREAFELKSLDLGLELAAASAGYVKPILFGYLPDQGEVKGRARLKGPTRQLALENLVFSVVSSDEFQVQYQGRIGRLPSNSDQSVSDVDIMVLVDAAQSKRISSFLGFDLPELGATSGDARLWGSQDHFQIQPIRVKAQNLAGMTTEINGSQIYRKKSDGTFLSETAFDIAVDAPNLLAAETLLGKKVLPQFGPLKARAKLSGTQQTLSLEDLHILVGRPGDLNVTCQGRIGEIPFGKGRSAADVDISLSMSGNEFARLSSLADFSFPDLGPFQITALVDEHPDGYGLKQVNVEIGSKERLLITAKGKVDSIQQGAEPAMSGIRLQSFLQAPHSGTVSKILGLQIPDLGELTGRFSLVGNLDLLAVTDAGMEIRSPAGLNISATGRIDRIVLGKALRFSGFDIKAAATAQDARLVPGLTDLGLPDFGPFVAEARIKDRKGSAEVGTYTVRAGPGEKASVVIDGKAYRGQQPGQIRTKIRLSMASAPWEENYFSRALSTLQQIDGKIDLTCQSSAFIFNTIELTTQDPGQFHLKAGGKATKREAAWRFEGQFFAKASDALIVQEILGYPRTLAEPVSLSGQVGGDEKRISLNSEISIGQSRIRTHADVVSVKDRPKVIAEIVSPALYLEDLGFLAPENGKKPVAHKMPEHFFGRERIAFEWLKNFDLDLTFKTDSVIGRKRSLDQCSADFSLADGRLKIGPAKLAYENGYVSVNSDIDIRGEIPKVALNIVAEGFDAEVLNLFFHHPWISDGLMNFAANLETTGDSPHTLAANLNGEIGIAVGSGKVLRIVDMVSADAIDLVTLLPRIKKYRDLNCLALQIEFQEGTGTSQTLILDTSDARATAKGTVDLDAEVLDIIIQPEKKSTALGGSSPLRIYGSFVNPKVKKIPLMEAARLIGEILMPYYFLPARALGIIWSMIKEDSQGLSHCLEMEP